MKNILIASLFISSCLQAQFTFKGTIDNYPNSRIVIKLNRAFDNILISNIMTDAYGSFTVPIKEKYNGVIDLSLFDAEKNLSFIADNTSIDFKASINPDNNLILSDPGSTINKKYQDYLNYDTKNNSVLPQLESIKELYSPNDEFYSAIQTEINKISFNNQPDISNFPFLNYYITTSNLIKNAEVEGNASSKNLILENLINAGEEFETSGLGRSMLYNYLKLASNNTSSQKDWENKVDQAIETFLNEVGEDTNRGQESLSAIINFLNGYGITTLANKYINRAESLTCEISPELKETINQNNSIKVGKILPDIKFTHKLNGKYSSLYDLKNKYKLILVWASWCGHCQQEMPFIKQFYENFKKQDGEIIGLSVDYNKNEWLKSTKDLPWLNDSDFLYWDSKFAKELNITGTPTLFLLDKNNKILKITSKISDISNLIK